MPSRDNISKLGDGDNAFFQIILSKTLIFYHSTLKITAVVHH